MADPKTYRALAGSLGVPALAIRGLRLSGDGSMVLSVERAEEPRTLQLDELSDAELAEFTTTVLRPPPARESPPRRSEDGTVTAAAVLLQWAADGGPKLSPPSCDQPLPTGLAEVAEKEESTPSQSAAKGEEDSPSGFPADREGCFRYRWWRRREGTEKTTPCPEEFVSRDPRSSDPRTANAGDWEVYDFAACLPGSFTMERALRVLQEELGEEADAALWGLVGEDPIDEDTTILRRNLASDTVEPLWNRWDAVASGYTPRASEAPRRTLTLRTLDFILSQRQGVPRTWQGFDLHHFVLDPIEAGAMSYRIYERHFQGQNTPESAFLDDLASFGQALLELRSDWDAMLIRVIAIVVLGLADIARFIGRVVTILTELQLCMQTGTDCGQLAGELGTALDELSDGLSFLGGQFSAGVQDLIIGITTFVRSTRELLDELDDYLNEYPDIEEAFMQGAFRLAQCTGLPELRWGGGPDAIDAGQDCRAACGPSQEVDLRDEATFVFRWGSGDSGLQAEEVSIVQNHGVFSRDDELAGLFRAGQNPFADFRWGNRVWFCVTNLDRAAMMFDWYVTLATRHFAYSHLTTDPGDTLRQVCAAHTALRMALGVAARWANTLLHETAHNLSVFHCDEPVERELGLTGTKVGCVQDIVAEAWFVNALAQKGLPAVEHFSAANAADGIEIQSKLTWNIDFGWDLGSCAGKSDLQPVGTYDKQFQPYYRTNAVECEQEQFADPEQIDTMQRIATILTVVGAFHLNAGLVAAGYLLRFVSDQIDELPPENDPRLEGDVLFNIDRPLEMGGVVTDCCFRELNQECADRSTAPCWANNEAPAGDRWRGCCCFEPQRPTWIDRDSPPENPHRPDKEMGK